MASLPGFTHIHAPALCSISRQFCIYPCANFRFHIKASFFGFIFHRVHFTAHTSLSLSDYHLSFIVTTPHFPPFDIISGWTVIYAFPLYTPLVGLHVYISRLEGIQEGS
ncbi:hypothetical protein BV22DRAFT_113160 [Leucogyrophana mollusca]|uniref:Uncharacterized protein n=1 Tax=Leucogyrophana mollusca TaxID=85980 RepID=A0ACB8BVE4_9AGAM|nr:hypothetical protein BV22DRAFT_113160 [Leucogyrophana mollusca]